PAPGEGRHPRAQDADQRRLGGEESHAGTIEGLPPVGHPGYFPQGVGNDLGAFSSTRFFIRKVLEQHRRSPISAHLEVETYTWNVLPAHLQAGGMEQAIARELNWVKQELGA